MGRWVARALIRLAAIAARHLLPRCGRRAMMWGAETSNLVALPPRERGKVRRRDSAGADGGGGPRLPGQLAFV